MLLLAGALAALASCQEPFNAKSGKGLRINVTTVSNSVATKTAYSGLMDGNFERISWNVGDQVRIFSEDVSLVARATGLNAGGGYVFSTGDDKDYYDYRIASIKTPSDDTGYKHDASLTTQNEEIGLAWVNDPTATAKVYGIYPEGTSEYFSGGQTFAGFRDLNIPAPGLDSGSDKTIDGITVRVFTPTSDYMKHAYMVAKPTKFENTEDEETGTNIPTVNLKFYPIFNAFEIQLQGLDDSDGETAINSVTLSSTTSNLTGDYKYDYLDKNSNGQLTNWDTNAASGVSGREKGPKDSGIDFTGNNGKSITVTFPSGTVISNAKGIKFTILTLPGKNTDSNSGFPLTDMTLTVNYGSNQTRSLALKQGSNFIQFNSFHKARLKGLKMKGEEWKIFFSVGVDDWVPLDTVNLPA